MLHCCADSAPSDSTYTYRVAPSKTAINLETLLAINIWDFRSSPLELIKRHSFQLCVPFQDALGKSRTLLETNALG